MPQTLKLQHVTHTSFTPFTHYIACEPSKLSYLGERSEPHEQAAKPPAFASPLACLSRVYFSRCLPNEELARRLHITFLDTLYNYMYAKVLDVFVWYIFSINHVEKANEAIAVETLLVTDELFR